MCLILFSYQPENNNRLIVLANRDEFYSRPTERAHFWSTSTNTAVENGGNSNDKDTILAGRDLVGGGTWLGINPECNRFAAVTNYREGPAGSEPKAAKSRGSLPIDFLKSTLDCMAFLRHVHRYGAAYNGYNMIVFDGETLAYLSNRSDKGPRKLGGGTYGLSNHLLDTPWPKVCKGKALLEKYLKEHQGGDGSSQYIHAPDESLFDVLLDTKKPPDDALPDTGVGIELEREYAPLFVNHKSAQYGTRCSTLAAMDGSGPIYFAEKTFNPEGLQPDILLFQFPQRNGDVTT